MGASLEIRVPDIGDFEDVEVVELLVAKGDTVAVDDPLVSIESDKATMEIPSTAAGVVAEVRVAEGDRVSEGTVLVLLDAEAEDDAVEDATGEVAVESPAEPAEPTMEASAPAAPAQTPTASDSPVEAPAVAQEVETIPESGVDASEEHPVDASAEPVLDESGSASRSGRPLSVAAAHPVPDRTGVPHASPLVRRAAREFGVPIESTSGTGPQGRVLMDDIKQRVRDRFAEQGSEPPSLERAADAPPVVDYSAFGPIRERALTRIQKVSGPSLQRSWRNVPHVTQHDAADVTELERFRRERGAQAKERGLKLSPLLFVMKAVVRVLDEFETLRSSLAPEGDRLIVKDYFHLGIAVDTDQGLVVPVIRDVDRKGVFELAAELSETAERARQRKLGPDDLKGACFTISSLGGIGGRSFSPIVNAPEVAILGLSKTRVEARWNGPSPLDWSNPEAAASSEAEGLAGSGSEGRFEPRLVLPFSLSYDHRVIDGAEAVRFTSRLARILSDPMQLLL
jgi:pyruvate dehydrogenase E2 component (dihydrolipoamide acetyltransferase)